MTVRNKERKQFSQQLVTSKKTSIHALGQFSSSVKVKTIKLIVKIKELLIGKYFYPI